MPRTDAKLPLCEMSEYLEYVLEQLEGLGEVTPRKMFGGAGLYRDGKMFGLIADDVAYLKVDDSNREAFERAGSSPFKPYADKATVMSYYEIPPDVLEEPGELVLFRTDFGDLGRSRDVAENFPENIPDAVAIYTHWGGAPDFHDVAFAIREEAIRLSRR